MLKQLDHNSLFVTAWSQMCQWLQYVESLKLQSLMRPLLKPQV